VKIVALKAEYIVHERYMNATRYLNIIILVYLLLFFNTKFLVDEGADTWFPPPLSLPASMMVVTVVTVTLNLHQPFIGRKRCRMEEIIISHRKERGYEGTGWIQPASGKVEFRAVEIMTWTFRKITK
jgi:hypothetical protein